MSKYFLDLFSRRWSLIYVEYIYAVILLDWFVREALAQSGVDRQGVVTPLHWGGWQNTEHGGGLIIGISWNIFSRY